MPAIPDPESAGKLSPSDRFRELGNRQLFRSNGYDYREFLPQLRGKRGIDTYREMLDNDAVVSAVMFEIEMLLRRVDWEVEPCPTGPDGEVTDYDIERADFLATCMADMSHSWEEFISDALTMLPFGFSYLEVVYKRRVAPGEKVAPEKRSDYSDGKIGWRKFVLIPQDTIQDWVLDDHGGVQSALQMHGSGMAYIPIQKALLFRTTRRSPTGRSAMRGAYRAYYLKKRVEEIEGIGIERDLAGLPVLYVNPDVYLRPDRMAEYQEIVRNIRRDEQEGVILPSLRDEHGNRDVELTLLGSGGDRQFDTDAVVSRYTRQIAMTLLQDVILLGHEAVGTQALAREKRDLSDTALDAWLNEVASVLNTHAVPRLLELNGMPLADAPRFRPGELRPTDVLEFTEALKNLAAAGITIGGDPAVENEARRRVGVPPLEEAVSERMTDELENPPEPPPMLPPGVPAPEGEPAVPETDEDPAPD